MAYTRTDTPQDALYALADRVPCAVVTNGSLGALGHRQRPARSPGAGAPGPGLDATGAGDVFGASLVVGTLAGWPLTTGSRSRPLLGPGRPAVRRLARRAGLGRHRRLVARHPHAADESLRVFLRRHYAFLDEIVPQVPGGAVRRAAATIARQADVAQH